MPWKVVKDTSSCPVSKPWAVKNTDTGTVNGRCHATKAQAEDQAKAMYASQNKKGKKVTMERYPQIIRAITGTPWLILPESLTTITEIVNAHLNGEGFSEDEIRTRLEIAQKEEERENPRIEVGGGVGIISLKGPIFPRANLMTQLSGATSLETFQSDLRELLADDSVKQIVMDVNSPGGASDLVHETGDLIRQAREEKPIYAVANTVAGSAALWLLSQATEAYATPSGKVGSLGVYTVHEDTSAADANAGRKITVVSSGDFKTALSPHAPLTDEAKAYLQESVDETKQQFVEQVALGRGLTTDYVEKTFGNAKVFSAKKAAEIKMVDGVKSMNDILGELVAGNASAKPLQATTALQQHVAQASLKIAGQEGAQLLDIILDGKSLSDRLIPDGGESVLKPEQLAELKAALGVTGGDDTDDEFVEKAKSVFTEHAELQKNLSTADVQRQFAELNPAMYAEHQRLLEKDRANEAKAFASSVSIIKKQVGDKIEETNFGLSAVTLESITKAHAKFAKGEGTLTDFEQAITAITSGGTVKFGEEGSNRTKDVTAINTSTKTGLQAARQMFAEKVSEVQIQHAKDNNGAQLDYMQAVTIAAQQNPELAAAYQLSATN